MHFQLPPRVPHCIAHAVIQPGPCTGPWPNVEAPTCRALIQAPRSPFHNMNDSSNTNPTASSAPALCQQFSRRRTLGRAPSLPTWACYEQILPPGSDSEHAGCPRACSRSALPAPSDTLPPTLQPRTHQRCLHHVGCALVPITFHAASRSLSLRLVTGALVHIHIPHAAPSSFLAAPLLSCLCTAKPRSPSTRAVGSRPCVRACAPPGSRLPTVFLGYRPVGPRPSPRPCIMHLCHLQSLWAA